MLILSMQKSEKIFVAGHRGMVGSALIRGLETPGFSKLLKRDRSELDLGDSEAVTKFFCNEKPEVVIFAAAKVGGIKANNEQPVEFLLENLRVQNNVIAAAHESGVRKLLFLGSSCIYPKLTPQPIPESALLNGPLEPTNEAYAIAKIAGVSEVTLRNRFQFMEGFMEQLILPRGRAPKVGTGNQLSP